MRFDVVAGLGVCLAASTLCVTADAQTPSIDDDLHIELSYHTLDNGLRVVLAEDDTVPTTTVAVYYEVGFRSEPRGRTGFAHLFEHLFFTGSRNIPGDGFHAFISEIGGIANGSTRLDFTNYFSVVPANALRPLLWAEADRMAAPTLSQSALDEQREVVRNETFVNVLNVPFGGASWIDLPIAANENWHNSHNFYGDLSDLDAAEMTEARAFFETYYVPRNAVLVVAGYFDHDDTLAYIDELFGAIPGGATRPDLDVSEPRQTEERHHTRYDPLASQPGLAIGYHMPERGSPEYFAMVMIDQLVLGGGDARLRQQLINQQGVAEAINGGINLLGTPFNYNGPMLWSIDVMHDESVDSQAVLDQIDLAIDALRTVPVTSDDLDRTRMKLMTSFYGQLDYSTRFGLADLLASFALFDDDPSRVNNITAGFEQVTPELILSTAREYLRPTNRTVLQLVPGVDASLSNVAPEDMSLAAPENSKTGDTP